MIDLGEEAKKLVQGMQEHIEAYGLDRLFRVLQNCASNAEKNFRKGNLHKTVSYLMMINLFATIGLEHTIKELGQAYKKAEDMKADELG